jgi:hypothetical protein
MHAPKMHPELLGRRHVRSLDDGTYCVPIHPGQVLWIDQAFQRMMEGCSPLQTLESGSCRFELPYARCHSVLAWSVGLAWNLDKEPWRSLSKSKELASLDRKEEFVCENVF